MNKSKAATGSQRLLSKIQLARIRLSYAESSLASAREQARLAKRRRKEAKQAARRARKQVKQAKADLQEAKQVLLAAEEKLALARRRAALARKRAKAREGAQAAAAKSRETRNGVPPHWSPTALSTPGRPKTSKPKLRPAAAGATQPVPICREVQRPPDATASLNESPGPAPESEI
jgi:hypothetical protein